MLIEISEDYKVSQYGRQFYLQSPLKQNQNSLKLKFEFSPDAVKKVIGTFCVCLSQGRFIEDTQDTQDKRSHVVYNEGCHESVNLNHNIPSRKEG